MTLFDDPQSRAYARFTGLMYLIIALAGGSAILYVPSQLHVAGDGAATMANIAARRGLFNLGIAGDVAIMLAEIMATTMLFMMFRRVNATLSLAAALARLTMAVVMAAMLFFHAGLVLLAEDPASLGLDAGTAAAMGGLLLHMHDAGVWIWQIFFTLHLAILGWLVARSGSYPRLLGWAMSLGSIGYLLDSYIGFAAPQAAFLASLDAGFLGLVTVAEVGFALWLLIVGPRHRAA